MLQMSILSPDLDLEWETDQFAASEINKMV